MLGVRHHHCLGYPDGGLVDVDPSSAVARLTALIDRVQPDTIVTFGPDGFTGHPDHRAVGQWATQAAAVHRSVRVLHAAKTTGWVQTFASLHERFPIFYPGYPQGVDAGRLAFDVCLDDHALDRKVRALRAQATQTAPIVTALGSTAWREWVRRESFVDGPPVGTCSTGARPPAQRATMSTAATILR